MTLFLLEAALAVTVGLAILTGWGARRWFVRGNEQAVGEVDRISESLAFVGGALGIIVGLLLVFAVQHFEDSKGVAREEAGNAVTLYHAVGPYPAAQRTALRHDVVCLMRSASTDDWQLASVGDMTGSENTFAWSKRTQAAVEALPQTTDTQASNHYFVTEASLNLDRSRLQRLLLGEPEIPPIVWIVIFTGTFAFVAMLEFHLASRRSLRVVAIGGVAIVLAVTVFALYELDRPYVGWSGSSLQPVALTTSLRQLESGFLAENWSPCPILVQPVKN